MILSLSTILFMIGIIFILVLIAVFAGYYFYRVAFYPHRYKVEESYRIEVENGRFDEQEFKSWPCEEVSIASPYGYTLYGNYFPLPGAKKTVVCSHGITYTLFGQVKYMQMFRKRGYNVLAYELRHHGRSGGPNTTFGFYEKNDLKAVVDWAFSRLGPQGKVGTQGESLGAGITLQHAAIDSRIAFAIPDCPYSDLWQLFTLRLSKDYHLPPFPLLTVADLFSQMLLGFSIHQVSPLKGIASIQAPILFVHGQKDTYIPPQMSVDMYKAKTNGLRALYLAPNAGHAQSLIENQAEYDQKVGEFLTQVEAAWK